MPLAMPGIPPSAPVTRPIAVEHPSASPLEQVRTSGSKC